MSDAEVATTEDEVQQPIALAHREAAATLALPDDNELARMERIAGALAQSQMVPVAYRRKPHDILAATLAGRELGLSPMAAMQRIHMIDGRPTLSAEAMVALVQRAGHEIWVDPASNESGATVHGQRRGSERVHTLTFTMDEAKAAGITNKSNWRSYPKAMLRARAISALCRIAFADVLAGYAYDPDELGAVTDDKGNVLEAKVVEPTTAPTDASTADEQAMPQELLDAREKFGEQAVIEASEAIRADLGIGKEITEFQHTRKARGDILRRILQRLEQDYTPIEDSGDHVEEAEVVDTPAPAVVEHPCPVCGSECAPISGPPRSPKWGCTNWDGCPGDDDNQPWKSWHNNPWKPGGQIETMRAENGSPADTSDDEATPTSEDVTTDAPSEPSVTGGGDGTATPEDPASTAPPSRDGDPDGRQELVDQINGALDRKDIAWGDVERAAAVVIAKHPDAKAPQGRRLRAYFDDKPFEYVYAIYERLGLDERLPV